MQINISELAVPGAILAIEIVPFKCFILDISVVSCGMPSNSKLCSSNPNPP